MKMIRKVLAITLVFGILSCNNDDNLSIDNEVKSFIYEALNVYYLYKDDQPLFNSNFNQINSGTPEEFFETLTVDEDRFSFIIDDYEILESYFEGTSLTDGIDFQLSYIDSAVNDDLVAYVNYVAKDSPGEAAGVARGDFFFSINGTQLTFNNYTDLLDIDDYTTELYTYDDITEDFTLRETVSVSKTEFTEDPIHINKVIEYEGLKIGYLMYNSFISGSENDLNVIFGEFASEGINELVLDLRYNGGGRVTTAVDLAGMITGQFTNEILISEQWNSERQAEIEAEDPEFLYSRFRDELTDESATLNSLNLSQVYILSSKGRTASASELVINGLDAYIDVIHIGDAEGTVGKSQASVTLYDSPLLYNKDNINGSHKYAIQPLIYRSANANGYSVPNDGLIPNVSYTEVATNLGVLGEVDEPLLNTALNTIIGASTAAKNTFIDNKFGDVVGNSKERNLNYQRMYE